MKISARWMGRCGYKNSPVEFDYMETGPYYFSLCHRQDADDPHPFRLFVSHPERGYKHLGGFDDADQARAFGLEWAARQSSLKPVLVDGKLTCPQDADGKYLPCRFDGPVFNVPPESRMSPLYMVDLPQSE